MNLTKKQQRVVECIQAFQRAHGYPPTLRELAAALHVKAIGTVQGYIRALCKKGVLVQRKDHARALRLLHSERPAWEIPIVGHVAAGQPVLAPEHISGTLPCGGLVADPQHTFALQVRGDSMINAGIRDGDFVLVHHQPTARNGDIVVVRVDDEVTVKRFFRDGAQRIRLVAENPTMAPLVFTDTSRVEIIGVVVGLYRRVK
ncbi:MAG: transcriptional repressor LexA [bacterium]|nr:transcriptional repressor LexA [bacterium]